MREEGAVGAALSRARWARRAAPGVGSSTPLYPAGSEGGPGAACQADPPRPAAQTRSSRMRQLEGRGAGGVPPGAHRGPARESFPNGPDLLICTFNSFFT